MGKPQVTLTLAGDSSKLEQTFGQVGSASKRMADEVGSSSKRVAEESESAFDRAGEGADGAESKAQGFSDTLTGTKDIMGGVGEIAKGNLFEGFVMAGQGAADLAGGMATFLIPALKKAYQNGIQATTAMVKQTAAAGVQKAAMVGSAVATGAMTLAQKGLNAAMKANPIGIVITLLALLVGGIIYAYKKSETFRSVVNGALNAVRAVAGSVFGWIRDNWRAITGILLAPFSLVVKPIYKHRDSILAAIRGVPGAISGFMSGVASTITAPFRAAFNGIRSAWNSTVGGKGFSVPSWVPNIGGKGFSIPYFHTGGIVSGAMGAETLAVVKAGERVTGGRNSGGGSTVVFKSDGSRVGKLLVQILRDAIRIEGGDVQVVLGK